MANNLSNIPANVQLPAHLADRIGKPSVLGQALMSGTGGSSFPRLSIKSSRFRIIEGGNETLIPSFTLDVVIVGANPRLSKQYYSKAWGTDSEGGAPDCASMDGITPDVGVTSPQADNCAQCPHAAWGSKIGPSGQQLKACADLKRLAVVASEDVGGPVYGLSVTPAALKGLNAYQRELSSRGIPAEVVITRLSFDPSASFPKLQFQLAGFMAAEQQAVVDGLLGSPEVLEVTGEVTQPQARPPQAPAPQPQAAQAQPQAQAPTRGFGATQALPPVGPQAQPQAQPQAAQAQPQAQVRGFGATQPQVAQVAPAARAQPQVRPASVTPPAPESNGTMDLAAEIAAMVGGMTDD